MNSNIKSKFEKSILLVLPGIFTILGILIHFSYGKFYMLNVDPEYFHLFNGLNLSIFNLSVDFIHHPGTTIQAIFAVSAHIVNFIIPGNNLISNALDNPEQFIHGASVLLIMLTSSAIFLLGFYAFKYTKNIFLALLLQFMPFVNFKILIISGRIIPEAALTAPILLLALLIVRFLYDSNREKNLKQYLIGFAIVGGLGIAGKLLYFPFLLIPLFVFSNTKTRFTYLLYTLIAIVVFAFPMFVHIGKSWEWVSGMFLHSGKWGQGETNVIDFASVPIHLKKIYNIDKSFIILTGIASLLLLFFYLISFVKKLTFSGVKMRILFGVLISILFSTLMVTKHFAYHYFIPTLVFKAFLLYLMTELLMDMFKSKSITIAIWGVAFAMTFIFFITQLSPLADNVQRLRIRAEKFTKREMILKKYSTINSPIIITNHFRGSPFKESAMVAGFLMSGHLKTTFRKQLTEKYPNTFFYYNWTEQFYFWDQFKNAEEFLDPEKSLFIFIGEDQEKNLKPIVSRLEAAFPDFEPKLELLRHFENPDEYFYEVSFRKK